MSEYLQALRRFWWLLVLGAWAGLLIAVFMLYRVELAVPPKLAIREQASYTASTRLLVTSATSPLLRTSEPQVQPPADGAEEESPLPPVDVSGPPNIGVLVQAANLYPVLIESDEVTALREELFGPIPGAVSAQSLFAIFRPFGGFVRSEFPVVEINAVSPTSEQAVRLVRATADAFIRWVETNQKGSNIRPKERILLQKLRAARATGAIGGPTYGLPALAFIAVFLASAVLAILLHRLLTAEKTSARSGLELERRQELRQVELEATPSADASARSCANCGSDYPDDARFCPQCGLSRRHPLAAVSPAGERQPPDTAE